MQSVYYLNSEELDIDFMRSIKTLFANRNIQITITECIDETDYLLQSKNNANQLLSAIENINKGQNLVEMNLGQLKQLTDEKADI